MRSLAIKTVIVLVVLAKKIGSKGFCEKISSSSQFTATEVFGRRPGEPLASTDVFPIRLGRALASAGIELRSILRERQP